MKKILYGLAIVLCYSVLYWRMVKLPLAVASAPQTGNPIPAQLPSLGRREIIFL